MKKPIAILYGLGAYAVSLATLSYLMGFSGDLLVPKSVDRGAGASLLPPHGVDLVLLAAFGVQHSLMARRGFKRWWSRVVPPVVERSTYLVASCAALGLLFALWMPIDTPIVWAVGNPIGRIALWVLFGLGWFVAAVSTCLIDHFSLFGLRQVFARPTRDAPPEDRRLTPLFYRYVRHPLYAGMLLGLWSAPVMTAGHLLFAAGLGVYILIGIAFEERDLLQRFGDGYRRYRQEVGMLVPWRRASVGRAEDGTHS
jgi:protein-S-isoprenylcysteine O-methyltransferase Ste14